MSAGIFIEGAARGAHSKEQQVRCRTAFHALLTKCGFAGRMPRLAACGGRGATFGDFKRALAGAKPGDYVAMWIDSEDPMQDVEQTWKHLGARDGWERPDGAKDDQVLMMTTCMEALIVADRKAVKEHFQRGLQERALPPLDALESRDRHSVQDGLVRATRNCSNAYAKGGRSFAIVGTLDPGTLAKHLPSFARTRRILDKKLR